MNGRTVAVVGVVVVLVCVSTPLIGQDLPTGTWAGTVRNAPPGNPNPRPASLVVQKGPDPLWRWRGGSNEIVTVTFRAAQQTAEVSDIQLAEGRLAYSFTAPGQDVRATCELTLQADGRYEGTCRGIPTALITLSPPEEEPGVEK